MIASTMKGAKGSIWLAEVRKSLNGIADRHRMLLPQKW
jgi:hypothetical protein